MPTEYARALAQIAAKAGGTLPAEQPGKRRGSNS